MYTLSVRPTSASSRSPRATPRTALPAEDCAPSRPTPSPANSNSNSNANSNSNSNSNNDNSSDNHSNT